MVSAFGELFKRHRINRRQTLREFCLKHGYDPGNISRLERGRMAPPKSTDKLEEYARALGLEPETDQFCEFVDLGLTCAGQIVPDVLTDEELVPKLPLLLRTVSGKKLSGKQLEEFIEKLRRA